MSNFLKYILCASLVLAVSFGFYSFLVKKQVREDEAMRELIQQYVDKSLATNVNPSLGEAVQNIAGTTYTLAGGGISSSATSITLSSLTLPQTGYEIVDSDLSSTFYITLEPGNRSKQEIVSCTTVSQSASNNTATLSGCTRGLLPISPYTASTTYAFAHGGGSTLIFSNPPQYDEQFAKQGNTATISGSWTYTTLPTSTVVCSTNYEFCNKQYVDGLTVQGAATSTEETLGLVELATNAEALGSTASSTSGRPLVLSSRFSTSTPGNICSSISCIVMTASGKIAQAFLNLTDNFTWSGTHTFNTATSTFNATTSIAASTSTAPLRLNGLFYAWPSTRAASGTVPIENGGGNITFQNLEFQKIGEAVYAANTATTTITVPARRNLLIRFMLTGRSTQAGVRLSFNSDEGVNYGHKVSLDQAAFSNAFGDRYINLDGSSGTTTRVYIDMTVTNEASRAKMIRWTGVTHDSNTPTVAGTAILGTGVWNNTSAQITSITLAGAISATISAGSIIEVYASKE